MKIGQNIQRKVNGNVQETLDMNGNHMFDNEANDLCHLTTR